MINSSGPKRLRCLRTRYTLTYLFHRETICRVTGIIGKLGSSRSGCWAFFYFIRWWWRFMLRCLPLQVPSCSWLIDRKPWICTAIWHPRMGRGGLWLVGHEQLILRELWISGSSERNSQKPRSDQVDIELCPRSSSKVVNVSSKYVSKRSLRQRYICTMHRHSQVIAALWTNKLSKQNC